ncbi:MAG: NERD domain-containing protein kinase family protein [Xanthomonadales bacterium]|nr:NERD domain-containing protein kinase family protein [Xanthomonadales bacterium]
MARHTRGGPPRNESERWAIDYARAGTARRLLGDSNIDITDQQGQRLEVDALVIGRWAIYLVEIKGYTGRVRAGERVWDLGGGHSEETPLVSLGYKSRVLASRIRDRITGAMHVPWCQATVFVTGNRGDGSRTCPEPPCGSVCDASDIIRTLTTEAGLTSKHVHEVTPEQREFAIQVLGQVGRLSEIDNQLQAFQLQKELFSSGGLSIYQACLANDEFERQFIVKKVERAAFSDPSERAVETQKLRDEFRLYLELFDVPGVPYAAPLIDDGECLALPIARPLGRMLVALDPRQLSLDDRLGVLRSTANVLERIHRRGVVHGALQPQSMFIGEDQQVELLDFAAGHTRPNEYSAPSVRSGRASEIS